MDARRDDDRQDPISALVSIPAVIGAGARSQPDAVALVAPDRAPLDHAGLLDHVLAVVGALRAAGVRKGDAVALSLPDGPEAAAAFLAVASGAVAAPLNPRYRAGELEFYLSDLRPKALVVQGEAAVAREVARRLGIAVLDLSPLAEGPAGLFTLGLDATRASFDGDLCGPADTALLLHTSGTTARPKIVPLTHANLCASARSVAAGLALGPDDRCLVVMPLFHIHGLVGALLSSLAAGGSVACPPGFDAPRFLGWARSLSATWYTAVPALHQAVLAHVHAGRPDAPPALRFVRSCSAPLPPPVMAQLERVLGVPVVEAYGMTEAAHQMASNPLPPGHRKPGSVGLPTGVEVAIADAAGAHLPRGTLGQIVIRGPGVTSGYRANPDANARAFREGWFRTGDQGYLDEDGYLFITGRLDEIINRGGEKISPREVEEVLLAHPGVAQALAFAMPDPLLGQEVAAAVVLRPGAAASERVLQEAVAGALADFKVPRRIAFVPDIPKGPTGKPQRVGAARRLGLEAAAASAPVPGRTVAPRNPVEERVAAAWTAVLGLAPAGVDDDFFRAGGDSILAGRMLARIEKDLGARLSFIDLFRGPTVAGMAAAVETARRLGSGRALPPIDRGEATDTWPLSYAQQRLWFVEQLHPGLPAYKPVTAIRLRGPLAIAALERALAEIVARHAPLRARFVERDGAPVQVIGPAARVDVPITEVEGADAGAREAEAVRLATAEAWLPFDIDKGPMWRVRLLRLSADDHVLLLTIHHLAFDAWSRGILIRELGTAYRAASAGGRSELPELPISYGDYVRWQQAFIQGDVVERDLAWWRQHLGQDPPVLELPLDRPRPAAQTFRGGRESFVVPPALRDALRELGQREGATVAMTLLAAFLTLLHRHTGRDSLVIGVPVSGRGQGETEELIGLFVNELVIRVGVSPDDTFQKVLARAREAMLGAYGHQELPFDRLVQVLRPARDLSRSPLFQVAFNHKTLPGRSLQFGAGIAWSEFDFDTGIAPFELTLDVTETPDALTCRLDYAADVFDPARMARLRDEYRRVLEAIAGGSQRTVAELPVVSEPDRARLRAWNETTTAYPRDVTVHALFAEQAARVPDAIAVSCGEEAWTYGQLARRAHALARHLRRLGVGPGGRVALCLPQSPVTVAAMVAVLEAGAAYVPLDPAAPPERMRHVLQDTGATVLLAGPGFELLAPGVTRVVLDGDGSRVEALPGDEFTPVGDAGDLAYVMYTSGSTGTPKGSAIPHRGIVRLVRDTNYITLSPSDRVAQVSTFAFDAATFEVWGALLHGARLVQIPKERALAPAELADDLRGLRIDVLFLTTSLFNHVAAEVPTAFGGVRDLLTGGEALDPNRARQVLRSGAPPQRLLNVYGPTENTTFSTWYHVREVPEGATQVPIGWPISNTRCHILDARQEPVPIGAAGELYLGGDGLAYGYWNNPAQTAASFLPVRSTDDPGPRLYRTGDRARYRSDGAIEFLGRGDDQVKIRGFRIELREIEIALRDHAEVDEAAVLVRDAGGEKRLVAYVRPKGGAQALAATALRSHLAARLPEYMIPAEWVLSATLPLTAGGKLDRRALPAHELAAAAPRAVTAPRNSTEEALVAIWKRLLAVDHVGTSDDFFEIGGHSLLAVRLVSDIEKKLGRKLPVATLLRAPTIVQLAAILDADRAAPSTTTSRVHALRESGKRPPLFCVGPFGSSAGEITALAFRNLAGALADDQPVYALQPPELVGASIRHTIPSVAERLLAEVRSIQASGPYHLLGYCIGGSLAFEMASRLRSEGEEVPLLLLLDSNQASPVEDGDGSDPRRVAGWAWRAASYGWRLARSDDRLGMLVSTAREKGKAVLDRAGFELWRRAGIPPGQDSNPVVLAQGLLGLYRPRPYPGHVELVYAVGTQEQHGFASDWGWSRLASGGLSVHPLPGDHASILQPPHVRALADTVRRCMDEARAAAGRRPGVRRVRGA